MMGLGWQELLIVLVVIMIVFGAGKIPEVGSALGRGMKEFKTEARDDQLTSGGGGHDGARVREPVEVRADHI